MEECVRLSKERKPHKFTESYADVWVCHIRPDWLLLWQQNDKELVLLLVDTGTHSDLFLTFLYNSGGKSIKDRSILVVCVYNIE